MLETKSERLVGENGYCFVCGGLGFLDKECPSCGKAARKKSFNLENREDSEEFVKAVELAGIPEIYRGVIWDGEILRSTKPEKEKDLSFDNYVKQLEKVSRTFASGRMPQKSAIIIAPAGYSKMTFAYSCMQMSVDNGLKVAPILDTVELKRFLTLAGDNPSYKIYGRMSYEEYIMSDVLFATVTKLPAYEWAYQAIEELIDRRSRKGLSTFVISRFGLGEISRKDYSNQFSAIATAVSNNGLKYPAVIKYRELGCNNEEI